METRLVNFGLRGGGRETTTELAGLCRQPASRVSGDGHMGPGLTPQSDGRIHAVDSRGSERDEPWLCLRGHDKNVCGITRNRGCKECDRLRKLWKARERQATDPRSKHYAIAMPALREMRHRHRVSQDRLARAAGLQHSFISELESGRKRATRHTASKILAAFEQITEERQVKMQRLRRAGLL